MNESLICVDKKIETGNIFDLMQIGEQYIIDHISWKVEKVWRERKDFPEISVEIIKELLANSFIHASYDSHAAHEINVYPDRVEICNPGTYPLEPADATTNDIQFSLKNECIAKIMYLCDLTYNFGECLHRVRELCEEKGLKYKFENTKFGFKSTLYRRALDDKWFNRDQNNLSNDEKKVFDIIKKDQTILLDELAEAISKSPSTAQRATRSLHAKGFIRRDRSKNIWIIMN